jgi:ribonuclease BN (tRNA processing enzyme)
MTAQPVFTITYWGVTGTLSAPLRPAEVTDKLVAAVCRLVEDGAVAGLCPGPGLEVAARRAVEALPFHLRSSYGGNTTCVEVTTPDATLIFDCGSGFRELGVDLAARWRAADPASPRRAHVLVTHPHMDHTYATPYFAPYYDPANYFTLWGTQEVLKSLDAVLSPGSDLSHLYFPPTYAEMKAIRKFCPVVAGEEVGIGATRVRTRALNHPGGCLAYRLDCGGRSFVFATDHEQPQVPDPGLAEFARGADLLYTEGQYTAAEYEGREGVAGDPPFPRRGWGHSPVEACVATAVAAGVRAVHVGHRDPRRSDGQIAAVDAYVRRLAAEEVRRAGLPDGACEALVPYEGLTVRI